MFSVNLHTASGFNEYFCFKKINVEFFCFNTRTLSGSCSQVFKMVSILEKILEFQKFRKRCLNFSFDFISRVTLTPENMTTCSDISPLPKTNIQIGK